MEDKYVKIANSLSLIGIISSVFNITNIDYYNYIHKHTTHNVTNTITISTH